MYVQQYGQHVSRAECLEEFESYAAVFQKFAVTIKIFTS